jgi:hypothetical protein
LPDYVSGAIYDIEPSELSFTLLCATAE